MYLQYKGAGGDVGKITFGKYIRSLFKNVIVCKKNYLVAKRILHLDLKKYLLIVILAVIILVILETFTF